MNKKETLTLIEIKPDPTQGERINGRRFKVVNMKNMISFKMGQKLTYNTVNEMIMIGRIEVIIRKAKESDYK